MNQFATAFRRAAEFSANEGVNAATALISTAGELNNACWGLWESFSGGDCAADESFGLLLLAEVIETAGPRD